MGPKSTHSVGLTSIFKPSQDLQSMLKVTQPLQLHWHITLLSFPFGVTVIAYPTSIYFQCYLQAIPYT